MERLTRFREGADQATKLQFGRDLMAALERLGVKPGDEFLIAPATAEGPAAEDPAADGLGGFTAGSDTSRKAALDNYPRSGSQREKVLACIRAAGVAGRTAHEVAEKTGLYYGSVTPRIGELKRGGWIQATDATRVSEHGSEAEVLVPTEKTYLHPCTTR